MTPWTIGYQVSLSFTISQSLIKFMSTEFVMLSNHFILCHTLLLLPSVFPSIRVFSNQLALCIRWPKYWSLNFNISPSNEHPGLISFRMDWLDLLAVQGTLKSLLQQHSSKASILRCSALFIVQLSHPHMTTGAQTCVISKTMKPSRPDSHSVGDAYMFDILCTYLDFKQFSLKSNMNSIPGPSFNLISLHSDLWDCLDNLKVKVPGTSAFWNAALKPKRRALGTEETLL